ncbi:MAG: permease prefix domain 1-containing protein [Muricomes sp.]
MTELKKYVDDLFHHQRLTPEIEDLKEEILSNMTAKQDDLIAQGFEESVAARKAKESLSSIDSLIDGNQLTYVGKYHTECSQAVLLNCTIFWILSFPLLFFIRYAIFSYMGLLLTVISGIVYFFRSRQQSDAVAFISIPANERRKKIVWVVWGLFFVVCIGMVAALTFGSNIWFHRPLDISGPYQMANIAIRFYLPLLTAIVPVTFSNFTKLLIKNRKGYENE